MPETSPDASQEAAGGSGRESKEKRVHRWRVINSSGVEEQFDSLEEAREYMNGLREQP